MGGRGAGRAARPPDFRPAPSEGARGRSGAGAGKSAGFPEARQRPSKTGVRFSFQARTPSRKSCDRRQAS